MFDMSLCSSLIVSLRFVLKDRWRRVPGLGEDEALWGREWKAL